MKAEKLVDQIVEALEQLKPHLYEVVDTENQRDAICKLYNEKAALELKLDSLEQELANVKRTENSFEYENLAHQYQCLQVRLQYVEKQFSEAETIRNRLTLENELLRTENEKLKTELKQMKEQRAVAFRYLGLGECPLI